MIHTITAFNAAQALEDALFLMKTVSRREESRNGKVRVMPGPTVIKITSPTERVVASEVRNCNHFYHLMETVWMLAGARDITWLEKFNKRVRDYCDPGTDYWHGAYGHRWRQSFGVDQIKKVISLIKSDHTTRRAVIGMWYPGSDLEPHNDLPCNTHLYFRVIGGKLDMTVCNRSNDLVWGALGANVVHMTYLQELVALGAGLGVGNYYIFTNNLHIYENREDFQRVWEDMDHRDIYTANVRPAPLLKQGETPDQLLRDCEIMVEDGREFETWWMGAVAHPAMEAYLARKAGEDGIEQAQDIGAADWRLACLDWIARRGTK